MKLPICLLYVKIEMTLISTSVYYLHQIKSLKYRIVIQTVSAYSTFSYFLRISLLSFFSYSFHLGARKVRGGGGIRHDLMTLQWANRCLWGEEGLPPFFPPPRFHFKFSVGRPSTLPFTQIFHSVVQLAQERRVLLRAKKVFHALLCLIRFVYLIYFFTAWIFLLKDTLFHFCTW